MCGESASTGNFCSPMPMAPILRYFSITGARLRNVGQFVGEEDDTPSGYWRAMATTVSLPPQPAARPYFEPAGSSTVLRDSHLALVRDQFGVAAAAIVGVLVDVDDRLGRSAPASGAARRARKVRRESMPVRISGHDEGIISSDAGDAAGCGDAGAGGRAAVRPADTYTAAERRHWAFQPRSQPAVPAFPAKADQQWVRNPIDAFILARLQKGGPAACSRRPTGAR